ncbi:MAG: hypothetical protein H7144_07360 [Burkholderiales bacterium]|nr:hypothetical protein [Phycisphaerae bacterium]
MKPILVKPILMKPILAFLTVAVLAVAARGEEIRIATYNVQLWQDKFDTRQVVQWAKTQPQSAELTKLATDERNQDNKDNWMIAQTILDPQLNPDILLFQEGPGQEDLDYFNKRWLGGVYKTAIVFTTNSTRGQETGILLKDGFKILETRDQYHKEIDTVAKDFLLTTQPADKTAEQSEEQVAVLKENRLFARGPALVLIQTPGGYKFWVGTNHQKSKSGNSVPVSAWRLREAKRQHEILKEIAATGDDVVFGGDMNDELGMQEFEQQAGGDSIAHIVGTDGEVILATKPLIDKGEISFGGYFNDRFRSLIDHFFVSKSLKDRVVSVAVFKDGLARAASDHYPVLLVIKSK